MFKLRKYQLEAIEQNILSLKENNRIINILPTASGKTEIMAQICATFVANNPNKKVLILSHLTELVEQTKGRIELRTDLKVGKMQAENYPSFNDQVIVGTRQTVFNFSNILPFKSSIGLIIVDEVHGFITKQYDDILRFFANTKLIGFTATPYKNAKLIINVFDTIAYSKSLEEMIEEDYVVKPILKPINMSDEAELTERIAQVINIQKSAERGKSAAIFMQKIEDCKIVRNTCKMNGISCCVVTSKTKQESRVKALQDFKDGKIEVLITCNVVSEGFDCPRLEVIYMPYQTTSPTLYIQRMGRAMRKFENKESCRVYAFGSAPQIKKGFFSALKMGRKKKNNVVEDMEFLELTGDTSCETYIWGKEICKISDKLKELGKDNIANSLINKELPKKYMNNPDLISKYMDKIDIDDPSCLENQILQAYGAENEYNITEGNQRGKHVKDLPWNYKKRAWEKDGYNWKYDTSVYKQIRKYYRTRRRKCS